MKYIFFFPFLFFCTQITNGFALVRPPGHHAMQSEFCGYCVFNNAAIAASHALNHGVKRWVWLYQCEYVCVCICACVRVHACVSVLWNARIRRPVQAPLALPMWGSKKKKNLLLLYPVVALLALHSVRLPLGQHPTCESDWGSQLWTCSPVSTLTCKPTHLSAHSPVSTLTETSWSTAASHGMEEM